MTTFQYYRLCQGERHPLILCTEKKKLVNGGDNQKSYGKKIHMKVPSYASENSYARDGLFIVSCLVFQFQLISRHTKQLCGRARGHHKLLCMKLRVQQTGHAGIRLSIGQRHWTENHCETRDATTSETGFQSRVTRFHPHS